MYVELQTGRGADIPSSENLIRFETPVNGQATAPRYPHPSPKGRSTIEDEIYFGVWTAAVQVLLFLQQITTWLLNNTVQSTNV